MAAKKTAGAKPGGKPRRLYLIDGSGYIFRAYFGINQRLTRPDGTLVNAVYGFSSMMMKLPVCRQVR